MAGGSAFTQYPSVVAAIASSPDCARGKEAEETTGLKIKSPSRANATGERKIKLAKRASQKLTAKASRFKKGVTLEQCQHAIAVMRPATPDEPVGEPTADELASIVDQLLEKGAS